MLSSKKVTHVYTRVLGQLIQLERDFNPGLDKAYVCLSDSAPFPFDEPTTCLVTDALGRKWYCYRTHTSNLNVDRMQVMLDKLSVSCTPSGFSRDRELCPLIIHLIVLYAKDEKDLSKILSQVKVSDKLKK